MSSSERAPEPTMEDILASIRRIITDDETSQATAEVPAQKAPAESGPVASEADSEIITDIENVLGGSAEAPAADEEEILDLTAELGGLEIVEDDVQEVVEVTEVTEVLEFDAAAPEAPVFKPSAPDEAQTAAVPLPDVTDVPPVPEAAPQMAAPEAPVAPEVQQPAEPEQTLSAGEEAATALERAIAALKAGQTPSAEAEPFQFQAAPEPDASVEQAQQEGPETTLEPILEPMADPTAIADTHPDPEAQSGLEPNLEVQPETAPALEPLEPEQGTETDLVLTEGRFEETLVEETAEKAPFWPAQESQAPEEAATAAEEETSSEEPSLVTEPQPEPVFASATEEAQDMAVSETNGAGAHLGEASGRSLEDSIKDMLRPMLRQWLDENMPRMIREELDTDALRRQQD